MDHCCHLRLDGICNNRIIELSHLKSPNLNGFKCFDEFVGHQGNGQAFAISFQFLAVRE